MVTPSCCTHGSHLTLTTGTGKLGYDRETSREATIAAGKKRIQGVAAALGLTGRHVDAAHRLFMLAVQHNFIQGEWVSGERVGRVRVCVRAG